MYLPRSRRLSNRLRWLLQGALPFLLVLASAGRAAAQSPTWTWQNPYPQGNDLHALHFVNATHGWATGDAGTILHTSDGGATWTSQHTGSFVAVDFLDANTGFALGGAVHRTDDGGETWTPQDSGVTATFYGAYFVDDQHGWIVGSGGTIVLQAMAARRGRRRIPA